MEQIGRYEIVRSLGRGGMGVVYLAHDPRFNRQVALKMLPKEVTLDETYRMRFEREARAIARLGHSAILPVHDFGTHEDQPYLVMAYMPGGSAADRVRRDGPMDIFEVQRTLRRVASALDAAHAAGIIHRDVKPANILYDGYGEAFLSDFGIVKMADETSNLTQDLIGTPHYMAPELLHKGGLSPLIDIYALGVTVYEMLTAKRPFDADTPQGVVYAHAINAIPDIRALRSELPYVLTDVIAQSLAKEPENRFQSAGELSAALDEAFAAAPIPYEDPSTEPVSSEEGVEGFAPGTEPMFAQLPPLPTGLVKRPPPPRTSQLALNEAGIDTNPPSGTNPQPIESKRSSGKGIWALAAILVVLVVGAIIAVASGIVPLTSDAPELVGSAASLEETQEAAPPDSPTATPEPEAAANDGPAEPAEANPPTATIEPTPSLDLPAQEQLALDGVGSNAGWEPYPQTIAGFEMLLVPSGCFEMGSATSNFDENPPHNVCITAPFWIDTFEVTNAQFGSVGCINRSSEDNQPRNCVTWAAAQAFCEARGGSLPTEAQWEYAARGPDSLIYPWGDEFEPGIVVYSATTTGRPEPVGSQPLGVSWIGAFDMSGNLWEWVSDWYDESYYQESPVDDPIGPRSGIERVFRGGSFDFDSSNLRTANRGFINPDSEVVNVGFRCALPYTPQ